MIIKSVNSNRDPFRAYGIPLPLKIRPISPSLPFELALKLPPVTKIRLALHDRRTPLSLPKGDLIAFLQRGGGLSNFENNLLFLEDISLLGLYGLFDKEDGLSRRDDIELFLPDFRLALIDALEALPRLEIAHLIALPPPGKRQFMALLVHRDFLALRPELLAELLALLERGPKLRVDLNLLQLPFFLGLPFSFEPLGVPLPLLLFSSFVSSGALWRGVVLSWL